MPPLTSRKCRSSPLRGTFESARRRCPPRHHTSSSPWATVPRLVAPTVTTPWAATTPAHTGSGGIRGARPSLGVRLRLPAGSRRAVLGHHAAAQARRVGRGRGDGRVRGDGARTPRPGRIGLGLADVAVDCCIARRPLAGARRPAGACPCLPCARRGCPRPRPAPARASAPGPARRRPRRPPWSWNRPPPGTGPSPRRSCS